MIAYNADIIYTIELCILCNVFSVLWQKHELLKKNPKPNNPNWRKVNVIKHQNYTLIKDDEKIVL